ncbi:Tim10/DDP family zinc finger-domain-containing protein [Hypomontagnella monticulosa]|nr:Tim10/DDP family zinc finger-domain-containing protein [Hypomontagnella monticulosa]
MSSEIKIENENLSQLSEKDKSELRQFMTNEEQKARIQATIHTLTDMCFRKCITSTIRNGKLDKTEEGCMTNCANRFIDVSHLTVKHLQSMRS